MVVRCRSGSTLCKNDLGFGSSIGKCCKPGGGNCPPSGPVKPINEAKGLSIRGADGSTRPGGSPIGEESPGREALPPIPVPADACISACMNCCWCSGSHAEGLCGVLVAAVELQRASKRLPSPTVEDVAEVLTVVVLRSETLRRGPEDMGTGGGGILLLSSPKKLCVLGPKDPEAFERG